MGKMVAPVKIACIQMDVVLKDTDANIKTALARIGEACAHNASLIILPETFNTGCMFETREEVYDVSESVPDGKTTKALEKAAAEKNVYIAGSIVERDGVNLYNTSVLVGPEGLIGRYRKVHLCEDELFWFEGGDLGFPVFKTRIGRIALAVCLDVYYPETIRLYALQKADIVCVSTNWMKPPQLPEPYATMGPTLVMANALSNYIFVAAANRVGEEAGALFPGQSLIANQWGIPVSGIAGDKEEILYADCDLSDTRKRYINSTNSRLGNRRTDLYGEYLGYQGEILH